MTEPTVTLYGRPSMSSLHEDQETARTSRSGLLYIDVDQDHDALDGLTELDWATALPVLVTPDL